MQQESDRKNKGPDLTRIPMNKYTFLVYVISIVRNIMGRDRKERV